MPAIVVKISRWLKQNPAIIALMIVSVTFGVVLTVSTLLWSLSTTLLIFGVFAIHALLSFKFHQTWLKNRYQVDQTQQFASGLTIDLWARAYRQYFNFNHCLIVAIFIALVLLLLALYGSQYWSLVLVAGLLASSFPFMYGYLPLNYSALLALCWQSDYPRLSSGWLDCLKSTALIQARFDGASETMVNENSEQYSQFVTLVQSAQVADGSALIKMADLQQLNLAGELRQRITASVPVFVCAAIVMYLCLYLGLVPGSLGGQHMDISDFNAMVQNRDENKGETSPEDEEISGEQAQEEGQAPGDESKGDSQGQESGDGSQGNGQGQDSGDGSQGTGQGQESGDGSQGNGQGQESGDGSQDDGQGQESGDGSQGNGQGQESGDGSQGNGQGQESGDGSQGNEQGQESGDGSQGNGQGQESGDGSQGNGQGQESGDGSQGNGEGLESGDGSQSNEQGQESGDGSQSNEQGQESGDGSQSNEQGQESGDDSQGNEQDQGSAEDPQSENTQDSEQQQTKGDDTGGKGNDLSQNNGNQDNNPMANINDNGEIIEIELPELTSVGQGAGDAKTQMKPHEKMVATTKHDTLNLHQKYKGQNETQLPAWITALLQEKGL